MRSTQSEIVWEGVDRDCLPSLTGLNGNAEISLTASWDDDTVLVWGDDGASSGGVAGWEESGFIDRQSGEVRVR